MAYGAALGLTAITDLLPAEVRFGHLQRLMGLLAMRHGLPTIPRRPLEARGREEKPTPPRREQDLRCLLVAGPLDGGGVEAVVSTLARHLPAHGIATEVVCTREGRTSSELRAAGIHVTQASSAAELTELIDQRRPDAIQLHRPDREMAAAVLSSNVAVVPVFHAMESYLDSPTWAVLTALANRTSVCVAVSEGVKTFFEDRLGVHGIQVVMNGVLPPGSAWERGEARRAVGRAVEAEITDDDLLVVALQRFSPQKNAAGLVDAFLEAVDTEPRLRLVLAGSTDNWLEVRRADLLRRASPLGGRVHLLGDSDPWVILQAGDVYALDSFAEGGPLSAVEAVMCGLPVVLSDVGFARKLVSSEGVQGVVVNRANADYSQSAMAVQRRRRRQSNRTEFGAALAAAGGYSRSPVGYVPPNFTEAAMVAGHATALRAALSPPESPDA